MKNLPERKKRVLCSNIEMALTLAYRISQTHSSTGETYHNASMIVEALKEIKEQALAMEKRLYLYKETLEGLGFKRVGK